MKKYTETHEWVDLQGSTGTVGITNHAQQELGEIVFVELPKIAQEIKAGEVASVLESTKAAVDIYSPLSGKIVEVNNLLKENSSLINTAAENSGWVYKIQISNPKELDSLMDEKTYTQWVEMKG